jgi:hypothetical protein
MMNPIIVSRSSAWKLNSPTTRKASMPPAIEAGMTTMTSRTVAHRAEERGHQREQDHEREQEILRHRPSAWWRSLALPA